MRMRRTNLMKRERLAVLAPEGELYGVSRANRQMLFKNRHV
jgi:hypothetical protein